jgi:hypothetical protein
MFSEGFSFPHPVLGLEDDISGEFNCTIEIDRLSKERLIRFYNLQYAISNEYIRNLIDSDKAGILIKVYCSSTFKTWTFINPKNEFTIDENDLFNKVEITALIVTMVQVENFQDISFHSHFEGVTFTVNPKEVLAVSGRLTMRIEKVNEKLGLGNIFKFFSQETDKPIHFTYHQNNIHIMYPIDGKGDHPPNALFKSAPWTAYNMFIIPALAEAFRFVENAREEAEGYEWFTVITNLLPEDDWLQDSFINAQLLLKKGIPVLNSYNELTYS